VMGFLSRLIMIPARHFQMVRIKFRSGSFRLSWRSSNKSMKSAGKVLLMLWLVAEAAGPLLADDGGQSRRIDLPVPVGHDVKGLRLPIRNDQGKMDMQFDMESARR